MPVGYAADFEHSLLRSFLRYQRLKLKGCEAVHRSFQDKANGKVQEFFQNGLEHRRQSRPYRLIWKVLRFDWLLWMLDLANRRGSDLLTSGISIHDSSRRLV